MFSEEEWGRRDDLRLELAKLLSDSALREALDVLVTKEASRPPPFTAVADIVAQKAMVGAERDGYFRAIRDLRFLSLQPSQRPVEMKSWEHLRPTK
jgi:hypothetical protein